MIQAIGESTALAVRGYAENHQMPGGRLRKKAADRVAIPTHHDGKRFRRLAALDRGAEIFAAWCLILGVAARCPTPGVLVDEQGEALSAEDLADMTGFPSQLFELGIAALLDERIGWLVRVPLNPAREVKGNDPSGSTPKPLASQLVVSTSVASNPDDSDTPEGPEPFFRDGGVFPVEKDVSESGSPPLAASGREDRSASEAGNPLRIPEASSFRQSPTVNPERRRIDEVEETLCQLSVFGRVSPRIYHSKEMTRSMCGERWKQTPGSVTRPRR